MTKEAFNTPVYMYTISNFINGDKDVALSTVLKFCKVLQCTPNDIIDYENYED